MIQQDKRIIQQGGRFSTVSISRVHDPLPCFQMKLQRIPEEKVTKLQTQRKIVSDSHTRQLQVPYVS